MFVFKEQHKDIMWILQGHCNKSALNNKEKWVKRVFKTILNK